MDHVTAFLTNMLVVSASSIVGIEIKAGMSLIPQGATNADVEAAVGGLKGWSTCQVQRSVTNPRHGCLAAANQAAGPYAQLTNKTSKRSGVRELV